MRVRVIVSTSSICLHALLGLIFVTITTTITATATNNDRNLEKYSSLPPTVFAPDGRLYSVERAAQRTSDIQDTSSSVAIALQCGPRDSNSISDSDPNHKPSFIVLVSLGPCSPHIYYSTNKNSNHDEEDENVKDPTSSFTSEQQQQSLMDFQDTTAPVTHHTIQPSNLYPKPPISLLHSSHLLAVTGGPAVDSAILLRRIQDISTTLYEEQDTILENEHYQQQQQQQRRGGGAGSSSSTYISSHTLARYCADCIQVPTQTTGSKYGRILSVCIRY